MDAELADRCQGAYLGLAIGDALGATVEFMTAREIAYRHGVHRDIVGGGWLKLPAGQVTDDTTMSLALGDALLVSHAAGEFGHPRPMADAWVAWLRGKPVDVGNTCRRGLQRYLADGSLQGPPNEGDAGNGALMRNGPVILATLFDDAAFECLSMVQARITHHHPLSDAAVLGFSRLVRAALLGASRGEVGALIHQFVTAHPRFNPQPYRGRASAYVVDTVQTVLHHALVQHDFEAALVATVNQGEDADTTGALAGLLAGALCGASALPARWLHRLKPSVRQSVADQAGALLALAQQRPAVFQLPEPALQALND
ncbi:ADP-ribosyl-(dinitrogen reductase) hydrolase [Burkholderiales bacterium JOSHI_001]|nr:ADP-ribosyl-(dinitrogen reductase) hydrolase [Burkholderiales bacterium JOSHI_001]